MPVWKQEFYVLPNSEVNEALAMYLTNIGMVEVKTKVMRLPDYTEGHGVYIIDKHLIEKLESNFDFRNKYKAFVRLKEGGKIYRHRSPEQIAQAKKRRARKDLKKTRLVATPAQ